MSEFEQVGGGAEFEQVGGGAEFEQVGGSAEFEDVAGGVEGEAQASPAETPVAAAMRELASLSERDLDEHPDVYQRIHAELQSALTTIDNA